MQPDHDFLDQVEIMIDEGCSEYSEYLSEHNDVDDIDELEEILNANNFDDLPIEFITDHSVRKDPDEWVSAAADWDPIEGKSVRVFLHATNLVKVWGPKTFKKVIMRMLAHETIHWKQYDKFDPTVLVTYKSGYMKGVELKAAGGTEQDLMRSYLRDPHELMAYGHDLAAEIRDTDVPLDALRGPERFVEELPVYKRYREYFTIESKQIKQLMKYTANYF